MCVSMLYAHVSSYLVFLTVEKACELRRVLHSRDSVARDVYLHCAHYLTGRRSKRACDLRRVISSIENLATAACWSGTAEQLPPTPSFRSSLLSISLLDLNAWVTKKGAGKWAKRRQWARAYLILYISQIFDGKLYLSWLIDCDDQRDMYSYLTVNLLLGWLRTAVVLSVWIAKRNSGRIGIQKMTLLTLLNIRGRSAYEIDGSHPSVLSS